MQPIHLFLTELLVFAMTRTLAMMLALFFATSCTLATMLALP
jgi:hypothetical protein